MVLVDHVTKTYGPTRAVDDVSFTVRGGEVVGFLGPNGAGKTTTMKIVTGFLAPTRGRVLVGGKDVLADPLGTKARVGYLPENNPLYREMVVYDYLQYAAEMRSIPQEARADRIVKMTQVCGLKGVVGKYIGELSKGYRQRVGLAQAMMHDPDVLILDEPTAGLDPNQVVEMRELVRELGKAKTVILSTHNLAEVEATCDRAIIIARGRVVKDATVADLQAARSGAGGTTYSIVVEPSGGQDADAFKALLLAVPGASAVRPGPREGSAYSFAIDATAGTDLRRGLFKLAVDGGHTLLELRREESKLEDVFHSLTTD